MLTHPANWELFKLSVFDQAVQMAEQERTMRCTEPEASRRTICGGAGEPG